MSASIKSNINLGRVDMSLAKSLDRQKTSVTSQQNDSITNDNNPSKIRGSIVSYQQKVLNAEIISSSLKYSNSAGDEPLSLLLKTALQGINEALEDEGIKNSVLSTYQSDVDYSPEASAERIVDFSTQLFSAYKADNREIGEAEALTSFVDIISGGIEQGFAEAREILDSLNVLDGDIAENIEKTYGLVKAGLQNFLDFIAKKE
jgi:hypothetical protein